MNNEIMNLFNYWWTKRWVSFFSHPTQPKGQHPLNCYHRFIMNILLTRVVIYGRFIIIPSWILLWCQNHKKESTTCPCTIIISSGLFDLNEHVYDLSQKNLYSTIFFQFGRAISLLSKDYCSWWASLNEDEISTSVLM